MRRREFIAGLGGAAALAMPGIAGAQQGERMRRVAVLMGWSEIETYRSWFIAFVERLAQLGWTDGRNVRIEQWWTDADIDRTRAFANELIELQPDVILAGTTPVTAALRRATRTIPIVFVLVADPVGAGFVAGLPRPGGNITGFINVEAGMGSKWLELLREIAPRISRVSIMFNPDTAPGGGNYFLPSFEAAARSLSIAAIMARVHSDAEIETAISSLGQAHGGLVVMTDSFTGVHRGTIISAAVRNNVPAIFDGVNSAIEGGLLAYGPNYPDMFRRAAAYVDRILRGAAPGDLPVEVPTKFDLAINLKTAKALGLTVPNTLLVSADKVIE
jgi:putative ABC transport system substrate-binding protein